MILRAVLVYLYGLYIYFQAFLIPYLVVLFFIGKPLYFLEMALGQFSSYGQVKVWSLAPFFKGMQPPHKTLNLNLIPIFGYFFKSEDHGHVLQESDMAAWWVQPASLASTLV